MTEADFFEEICTARDFMGSTKTTDAQWEAIIKRLGMLTVREETPKHLRYIAEGQLFEAVRRFQFVQLSRAPSKEDLP